MAGCRSQSYRRYCERRRGRCSPPVGRSAPHAIRQYTFLCRMDCGRLGGGDCLHDLGVDGSTMSTDNLSSCILSLVTFAPLAGALLLMLLPRRDRDIRIFAFAISLLTFVLSLHLPVYFRRGQGGFQFPIDRQWVAASKIHYHMGVDGISLWLVVL